MNLISRITDWQLSWLDRLIPDISTLSSEDIRRARLFVGIIFYAIAFNLPLTSLRYLSEGWIGATISSTFTSAVLAMLLISYKLSGRLNLITDVSLLVSMGSMGFTLFNDEGLMSRGVFWFTVFPLVSQAISHRIKAKEAMALSWLILLGLYYCHSKGFIISTEPLSGLLGRGITVSIVILFITIVTLIYDNTRQILNQQLIIEKENAEQAFRQKSEFLATMSHELRTPFNGVLGMLELLSKSHLTEQQHHRVGLAKNSAESLLLLINDILDFSKIEAGKQDIENIEFDLQGLFGNIAEAMAYHANNKGIEIILDTHYLERHTFIGDPNRIRQITTNLIGNAIKFTSKGNVVVKVKSKPDGEHSKITVEIQDSGIGIAKDKINLLFNSFTQVDASTSRKFGGSGLGLAIAKELSNLMGGDISVTSEEGIGSTFSFSIIVKNSETIPNKQSLPEIFNKQIIVIDDNEQILQSVKDQLPSTNSTLKLFSDSKLALKYIKNNQRPAIDLIITDIALPNMSGIDLIKEIISLPHLSHTKFVVMSEINTIDSEQTLSDLKIDFSFPKPITFKDLSHTLALISDIPVIEPHKSDNQTHITKPPINNQLIQTRILVVDDSPINLEVAAALLDTFDIHPVLASSAEDAYKILTMHPNKDFIHCILMDCQMPEIDGFEATKAIRSGQAGIQYKQVPIIALTANSMSGDKEKCIAAGMDDYLTKPIDINKLTAGISRQLSRTPSRSNLDHLK